MNVICFCELEVTEAGFWMEAWDGGLKDRGCGLILVVMFT